MRKAKRQFTSSDCAAACISYIADFYRIKIPTSKVRLMAGTTTSGTTALGVVEAFKALGFSAKGIKAELSYLANIPTPSIVHMVLDRGAGHYVVLLGVNRGIVKVTAVQL